MKGFILSMDALFSLTVLIILLGIVTFYFSGMSFGAFQSTALYDFASDLGAALEKGGYFEKAIDENEMTELSTILNVSPQKLCLELRIYSSEDINSVLFSTYKVGCVSKYSERASYKRSFFSNKAGKAYLAEVLAWYR
ncbi:MAG: hypothetical protein N3F05_02240 [Candidatus Diapherotrites archaeon]|nr:hypothetical protein [Candidatus Diapherotrites archaeon]